MQRTKEMVRVLYDKKGVNFAFRSAHCGVKAKSCIVLPGTALISRFSSSSSFRNVLVDLSSTFIASVTVHDGCNVVNRLSLLRGPIVGLSSRSFRTYRRTVRYVQRHLRSESRLFQRRLVKDLLATRVLSLCSVRTHDRGGMRISRRVTSLLQGFVRLLCSNRCVQGQSLSFCTSQLYVAPRCLSRVYGGMDNGPTAC